MTLFSFRTLALAWTGLASVVAVGAGALQASYVPQPSILVVPQPAAASIPEPAAASIPEPAPPVMHAALPFENRSLSVVLPHLTAIPAAPLPVPPIPPARVAHAEPRHPAPPRAYRTEPAYAAEPTYPGWGWDRRLPYPGQYASGQAPYYGGQPYRYGWPSQY